MEGVLNVWVGPADDPAAARPVTHDTCRPIRFYGWAYTDQRVLYIHDKHGDENWQLYSVDLKAGALKRLTPMEGVQARIQHTSHKFPDEVLVAPNDRDPRLHDAYRVNISTGEMRLVQQNPGFVGILTGDDYDIRLATRVTPDGGSEIPQPIADGGWEVYIKIEMEDVLTTNPCTTPPSRSSMPTGIGPTGIRRRSGE